MAATNLEAGPHLKMQHQAEMVVNTPDSATETI